MATQGQRKRSGSTRRGAGASGDQALIALASGMRGISELAGNRAMISMLARKKGEAPIEDVSDGEQFDLETHEEMLAKLRLALDADIEDAKDDPKKLLELVKHHILELLAVMHGALDQADGYEGDLVEEFEKLSRLDHDPGQHRAEAMLELLGAVKRHGEEIHSKLAEQLPVHGGQAEAPKVPLDLITTLKNEMRQLREAVQADKPPKNKDAHADGGAGALSMLGGGALLKKKQR